MCDLRTTEYGFKTALKKFRRFKKLKEIENLRRSYILVACLKWAAYVKKQAPSVKICFKSTPVSRLTFCQRIVC